MGWPGGSSVGFAQAHSCSAVIWGLSLVRTVGQLRLTLPWSSIPNPLLYGSLRTAFQEILCMKSKVPWGLSSEVTYHHFYHVLLVTANYKANPDLKMGGNLPLDGRSGKVTLQRGMHTRKGDLWSHFANSYGNQDLGVVCYQGIIYPHLTEFLNHWILGASSSHW